MYYFSHSWGSIRWILGTLCLYSLHDYIVGFFFRMQDKIDFYFYIFVDNDDEDVIVQTLNFSCVWFIICVFIIFCLVISFLFIWYGVVIVNVFCLVNSKRKPRFPRFFIIDKIYFCRLLWLIFGLCDELTQWFNILMNENKYNLRSIDILESLSV